MEISEALAHNLPGILAITLGCLIPMVVVGFTHWRKVRMHEQDAILKRSMIEKGMSAEEIVKVLNAGSEKDMFGKKC